MEKLTGKLCRHFCGHYIPADHGTAGPSEWKKTVSGEGAITSNGDSVRLELTSGSGAGLAELALGDKLPFLLSDLIRARFIAKCSSISAAEVQVSFGMASAINGTATDSLAANAMFRGIGSNTIVLESDDGTNDNDDVASGLSFDADWQDFLIDFTQTQQKMPPAVSLGTGSNVRFEGTNGQIRRTAGEAQLFDMSNYTGKLQPFARVQKASGTGVVTLDIKLIEVEYKLTT